MRYVDPNQPGSKVQFKAQYEKLYWWRVGRSCKR